MWNFVELHIFKMQWLFDLVTKLLTLLGLNAGSKIFTSLHFFIYDIVKISIMLSVLIFFVSLIQSYFPAERSKKIIGRYKGVSGNIVSALLGTVTPFCSCSSIPLFMGFTGAGLPIGVSFSFLISSPMVDLGSLVLLMTIFGPKIAFIYVLVGLIIAVIGGLIIDKLDMERYIEDFVLQNRGSNIELEIEELSIKDRIDFAKDQVVDTFKKVFPYIVIGVGIGSLIHNWVPQDWISSVLGRKNILAVVIATLVGTPMYGDIFGAIPVSEALLKKGAQLGVVLSFMMSVTTLSLPSLIMLRRIVKPKLLGLFIAICVIGIIIVGYLFNTLQMFLI